MLREPESHLGRRQAHQQLHDSLGETILLFSSATGPLFMGMSPTKSLELTSFTDLSTSWKYGGCMTLVKQNSSWLNFPRESWLWVEDNLRKIFSSEPQGLVPPPFISDLVREQVIGLGSFSYQKASKIHLNHSKITIIEHKISFQKKWPPHKLLKIENHLNPKFTKKLF